MDNTALFEARRNRRDLSWTDIAASAAWRPVVEVFARWMREPLTEKSGYTSAELDDFEHKHGLLIPMPLRDWWRLAGKHAFVATPLDCSSFALPTDRRVGPLDGLIVVTYEDVQSGAYTGITVGHFDQIDPVTHGRNEGGSNGEIVVPTGLTVSELVHVNLLWQLTLLTGGELNPKSVVPVIMPEKSYVAYADPSAVEPGFECKVGECDRQLNLPMIAAQFGLKHFHHPILFGDIHASPDIIRSFLGYAFRTTAAVEQFRAFAEAAGGICAGVWTDDPILKLYEVGDGYVDAATGKRWRHVEVSREEVHMPETLIGKRTMPARTIVRSRHKLLEVKPGG